MCGRFTLSKPVQTVAALFNLAEPPEILAPRYNIAPTQTIAAIGLKPDGVSHGLRMIRWGLVPHWTQNPKKIPLHINARAEGIEAKTAFAESFRTRRCLIPADGFYEWEKAGKARKPRHFRLRDGDLFAFAGLWDAWRGDDGQLLLSCCIITTEANDLVRPLHDRMPVILKTGNYAAWLAPKTSTPELLDLMKPYPAIEMEGIEVVPLVNKATNEGPECLTPA
jgi:putative SOS response-associated peptidase YedK